MRSGDFCGCCRQAHHELFAAAVLIHMDMGHAWANVKQRRSQAMVHACKAQATLLRDAYIAAVGKDTVGCECCGKELGKGAAI
jgi:hypothetical protein